VELLFVVLIGALLGLLGRGVLPGRHQLGVVLLPAIGGSAAAIVWVAAAWTRLPQNALLWLAVAVAAALSVAAACLLTARARDREDERRFEAVSSGRG
jgi:hypothetical protein